MSVADLCASGAFHRGVAHLTGINSNSKLIGTTPEIGFFFDRDFGCQKHHFKPKKREYF